MLNTNVMPPVFDERAAKLRQDLRPQGRFEAAQLVQFALPHACGHVDVTNLLVPDETWDVDQAVALFERLLSAASRMLTRDLSPLPALPAFRSGSAVTYGEYDAASAERTTVLDNNTRIATEAIDQLLRGWASSAGWQLLVDTSEDVDLPRLVVPTAARECRCVRPHQTATIGTQVAEVEMLKSSDGGAWVRVGGDWDDAGVLASRIGRCADDALDEVVSLEGELASLESRVQQATARLSSLTFDEYERLRNDQRRLYAATGTAMLPGAEARASTDARARVAQRMLPEGLVRLEATDTLGLNQPWWLEQFVVQLLAS